MKSEVAILDQSDFKYALLLAKVVEITETNDNIQNVNLMATIIDLKNGHSKKKTEVDLIIDGLTW